MKIWKITLHSYFYCVFTTYDFFFLFYILKKDLSFTIFLQFNPFWQKKKKKPIFLRLFFKKSNLNVLLSICSRSSFSSFPARWHVRLLTIKISSDISWFSTQINKIHVQIWIYSQPRSQMVGTNKSGRTAESPWQWLDRLQAGPILKLVRLWHLANSVRLASSLLWTKRDPIETLFFFDEAVACPTSGGGCLSPRLSGHGRKLVDEWTFLFFFKKY